MFFNLSDTIIIVNNLKEIRDIEMKTLPLLFIQSHGSIDVYADSSVV
jgi:hypothetical protein